MTQINLIMAAILFGCGLLGFLTRRNLILMFLSLELMLFGVSLNFITFGNMHGDLGGQTFVILILTVAACEAALALALIVALYRSRGSLDIALWQALREADSGGAASATGAAMSPASDDADTYGDMPKLTPAGFDPLENPAPVELRNRESVGPA